MEQLGLGSGADKVPIGAMLKTMRHGKMRHRMVKLRRTVEVLTESEILKRVEMADCSDRCPQTVRPALGTAVRQRLQRLKVWAVLPPARRAERPHRNLKA